MFENYFPVIHGILNHLDLQDIMKFRLVCSSFKYTVDDYLKNQENLSIFVGFVSENDLSLISSMRSKYQSCGHLAVLLRDLGKEKEIEFENFVLKFLPNIRQLFLFYRRDSYFKQRSTTKFSMSHWKIVIVF